jgi:predicted DNA-binding transcriptional regulator AlpA
MFPARFGGRDMKRKQPAGIPLAAQHFDELPNSAGVDVQVAAIVSGAGSIGTAWRWSKTGRLPRPYKAGPNSTRWNVGELRHAIAAMKSPAAV